jgi:hypothetical protein
VARVVLDFIWGAYVWIGHGTRAGGVMALILGVMLLARARRTAESV